MSTSTVPSAALDAIPAGVPNPLALIELALKSQVAPDQIGELYKLAQRWQDDRVAEAFAEAITGFQNECPVIYKGKTADTGKFIYKFADYSDVMLEIRPLLRKYRLAVTFATEQAGNQLKVICKVRHGTHVEETPFTVPIPQMPVNATQQFGAALSYAKRYALCAALNIVVADDMDDDAAPLVARVTEAQAKEVADLVKKAGRKIESFLHWAGVESLKDLSVAKYQEATRMLQGKRPANGTPKQKAGAK